MDNAPHQDLFLQFGLETHITVHDFNLRILQPSTQGEVRLNPEQAKALAAFLNKALAVGAL